MILLCLVGLIYSLGFGFVLDFKIVSPFVALFSVGAILALLWGSFCSLLSWLRKRRWGLILSNLTFLLILTGLLIFIAISGIMIQAAAQTPPPGATLILLGCQVRGETPSPMLALRIEAARSYLEESESVVILSGGQGTGEWITEAEAMRRALTAKGINEGRLILEEQSTSTRENIRFSRLLMEENHLPENVAIVTDSFHQFRAQTFAKQEGLTPGAVASHTPLSVLPFYWVREVMAIIVQIAAPSRFAAGNV